MENCSNHPYTKTRERNLKSIKLPPNNTNKPPLQNHGAYGHQCLVWFLESNNLMPNSHCRFRKQISNMDHMVKLETSIREANIPKQYLIAVLFDLEKFNETTWRFGIMKDLNRFGLRGRLLNFIKSFLSNRKFLIRVGSNFSNFNKQEEGVPQRSNLLVILFNQKINNITNYVGDFCISRSDENTCTQQSVNSNNAPRKSVNGQTQTILRFPKVKLCVCIFWAVSMV